MKTSLQTWASDRWAYNTSTAYWRTLPMLSMGKFLVAAFITWCAVGFVIDLLLVNYQTLGRGFFWPIYFGTLGTAVFAARMKRTGLVPVLLLITGAGLWLAVRISFHSSASPGLEAMHRRTFLLPVGDSAFCIFACPRFEFWLLRATRHFCASPVSIALLFDASARIRLACLIKPSCRQGRG